MVVIAIPLSAAESVRNSQDDVRGDDLPATLQAARDARRVEPFAALPRLQEALVLEAQDRLAPALGPAVEATRLEPEEWRAWLIRSRIEAELGRERASAAAYSRARTLNPNSPLFAG